MTTALGFMKETGTPDFLGWVTIYKVIPSPFPPLLLKKTPSIPEVKQRSDK